MKYLLISLFAILLLSVAGYSQTTPEPTPDTVVITRAAAIKALQDSDTVKAQSVLIESLNQAITDYKKQIADIQIQFANVSGENSALKQNAVSDRAIIELLLKSVKPKKIGLINF